MTIVIRRANERGARSLDWLESKFTFAFGDYYDPRNLGFGALRALNENSVAADRGFDEARLTDLEIISYVCDGALRHRDSLGNDVVVSAGGVQRLSAGRGVAHRQVNASSTEPLRFIQVWILPNSLDATPSYETIARAPAPPAGGLRLLGSQTGRQGSLTIDRELDFYLAALREGETIAHPLGPDREVWFHVLKGAVAIEGEQLRAGDGAGLQDLEILTIAADEEAEALVFDMQRG
ncbi:MAG: pirin family protein [Pseudomonadota bacterium]